LDGAALALTVFDDGSGPALHAAGGFTTAGGGAANSIARWDGASWQALGGGMNGPVQALAVYDAGEGDVLYAGGSYDHAYDTGDSFLSRWACPDSIGVGAPYCFGDGTGAACPCGGFGFLGEGCANSSGLGGAQLTADGLASITQSTFKLHVTGVPGNKPGLILRGANSLSGIPLGDGVLCTSGQTARSQVQITVGGATTFADFQGSPFASSSYGAGVETNYQFWYRDTANTCSGAGFNFTNAWRTIWLP
jgi:hypothetical protein